jgi:hypothetical protein
VSPPAQFTTLLVTTLCFSGQHNDRRATGIDGLEPDRFDCIAMPGTPEVNILLLYFFAL